MREEQTSKINWITRRKDWRRKKADWYSIIAVSVVLRGWREIISKRDSMGGGFIWRHLSALLLLRNRSFMLCASMSASNICLFPALLFAVASLGYYPTPLLESGFFFFLSFSSVYQFEILMSKRFSNQFTSIFITQVGRGAGQSVKIDNVYKDVVYTES